MKMTTKTFSPSASAGFHFSGILFVQTKSFRLLAQHKWVYKSETLYTVLWDYSNLNFAREFMQSEYADYEPLVSSCSGSARICIRHVYLNTPKHMCRSPLATVFIYVDEKWGWRIPVQMGCSRLCIDDVMMKVNFWSTHKIKIFYETPDPLDSVLKTVPLHFTGAKPLDGLAISHTTTYKRDDPLSSSLQ